MIYAFNLQYHKLFLIVKYRVICLLREQFGETNSHKSENIVWIYE